MGADCTTPARGAGAARAAGAALAAGVATERRPPVSHGISMAAAGICVLLSRAYVCHQNTLPDCFADK